MIGAPSACLHAGRPPLLELATLSRQVVAQSGLGALQRKLAERNSAKAPGPAAPAPAQARGPSAVSYAPPGFLLLITAAADA